jgi:hypothetical protein
MKFELKFSDLRFWVLTYFVHWDNASHIEAMQSSQDEEYPWIDNNDNDAPSSHHAEAEWTSLSTNFTTVSEKTHK